MTEVRRVKRIVFLGKTSNEIISYSGKKKKEEELLWMMRKGIATFGVDEKRYYFFVFFFQLKKNIKMHCFHIFENDKML